MTKRMVDDAVAIWRAGVDAVLPDVLIRRFVECRPLPDDSFSLSFRGESFTLPPTGRVVVIGMGKASGRMAAALEEVARPLVERGRLSGWVNVPSDSVFPLASIHLHAGRPAGLNEPTEAGVEGSRRIFSLLESATPDDLVIALVSGGGSALLPLPVPEISLAEKGAVTRFLSSAGANIGELNTVRKELSLFKGGGIRRLCRGKRLVALILSDVLGDPLDVIASGATVESRTNVSDALDVLTRFGADSRPELAGICRFLRSKAEKGTDEGTDSEMPDDYRDHRNFILANNAAAVDAAALEAERRGYETVRFYAFRNEGDVAEVADGLLGERMGARLGKRTAWISGGEPVVTLAPESIRGKGGRNSQLALILLSKAIRTPEAFPDRFVFLSGGTDGEDGPTNAAGAFFDEEIRNRLAGESDGSDRIEDALRRNDAYSFFQGNGGLFRTGPTGTNVCDLRLFLEDG